MNRNAKISRRVALDYMVIGMALGNPKAIGQQIKPNELMTHVGRALYSAVIETDREAFRDCFQVRMGFKFNEGEKIGEGLIRFLKESNVDQSIWSVGVMMSEQLAKFDDLEDMIELLERATTALKQAKMEREACQGR